MRRGAIIATQGDPLMTLKEWGDLPEDEPGELLDGRLVEEEMPNYIHETIVAWLLGVLRAWVVPRGGFAAGSEAKFGVGARRGRKPDLTVYLPGRRPPGRAAVIDVPPDIAVEVVSPTPRDGRRDRVEKVEDYAAFRVRFYWIVDPELRSIEILELESSGRYVRALGAAAGRIDAVPGCEGLMLDLNALWVEVDRLGRESAAQASGRSKRETRRRPIGGRRKR
jgi:Uma2 family endonuclease